MESHNACQYEACLVFVSLIQIEYTFDYVILFALNEKWSSPHRAKQRIFFGPRLALPITTYPRCAMRWKHFREY